MSTYFDALNLPGFARWMRLQSDEERLHGLRLFDYLNRRRCRATLQAIDAPLADFGSPLDAVEMAFEHEQMVTRSINDLYELAASDRDHATRIEMEWFVTEQVEEEQNAELLVERVKMAAGDGAALLILDDQLAARQAATAA
jgi:ferritin